MRVIERSQAVGSRLRQWIRQAVAVVNRVAEELTRVALLSLLVTVLTAITCRFLLGFALIWAEELARYLSMWAVFLGAGIAVGKGMHVGIGIAWARAPVAFRTALPRIVRIVLTLIVGTLFVVGLQFSLFMWHARSLLLPVSMGVVYLCVPAGALVAAVNLSSSTVRSA